MLVIGIVIWLVSTFVTLAIFKSKGRSSWGGFAIGFFLGIIGVVIALLIQPDQEKLNQRKFESGQFERCPYCKEFVNADATICKHCHQSLQPEITLYSRGPVNITNKRIVTTEKTIFIRGLVPVTVKESRNQQYKIFLNDKSGNEVWYLESDNLERTHKVAEAINQAIKSQP